MSQSDRKGYEKTFVKASPVIRRILEILTEKWGGQISPNGKRYNTTPTTTRLILLACDYMGIDTSHIERPSSWGRDIENPGIYQDDPTLNPDAVFEEFEGGFPDRLIDFRYYEKVNLYLRMDKELFAIIQNLAKEWGAQINYKSQEYTISDAVPRLLLITFRFLGIDVSYFDIPLSWTNDMTNLRDYYKTDPADKEAKPVVTAELINMLAPAVANELLPSLQLMIESAIESALAKQVKAKKAK